MESLQVKYSAKGMAFCPAFKHAGIAGQEIGCFPSQKTERNALCHFCQEIRHHTVELIQIGKWPAKHHAEDFGSDFGQAQIGFGRCVSVWSLKFHTTVFFHRR